MHETPDDLARLQDLLDRSFAAAGDHLASMFGPADRLSAADLVQRLPGVFEVHLAVTTRDGSPLVAPVDAQLFRGDVWFGLPAPSVRNAIVRRDGRASASCTDGSFALIVHGVARPIEECEPERAAGYEAFVVGCYRDILGPEWSPSGEGFTGWIEPRRLYAKR